MARSIQINEEDRRLLQGLLEDLHLTQKQFSLQAEVPQGWMSRILSGKRTAVEPEMWEKVGKSAAYFLDDSEHAGKLTGNDREARRSKVEATFFRRGEERLIALPGGAIPPNAKNFVHRTEESEALRLFHSAPFTCSVVGEPKTGKTTFLRWLGGEAAERGFQVSYVDCINLLPEPLTGSEPEPERMLHEILRHIAVHLVEDWSLAEAKTEGITFMNWWLRMKGPLAAERGRRRLLVVDSLGHLGPRLAPHVMKWVHAVHNERATAGIPLSFALGLADTPAMSGVLSSPWYNVVRTVELGPLQVTQIRTLIDPFLDSMSTQDIEREFKDLAWSPYGVHLKAVVMSGKMPSGQDRYRETLDGLTRASRKWEDVGH